MKKSAKFSFNFHYLYKYLINLKIKKLYFLVIACCCAIMLPNLEFILGLNGATSSIFIAYIMPPLMYLKINITEKGKLVYNYYRHVFYVIN